MKVYRIDITDYPEGSHDPETGLPDPDWSPDCWGDVLATVTDDSPSALRDARDTGQFFWPTVQAFYRSRSTATKRAALLRKYGAEVAIVSGRIEWEPK